MPFAACRRSASNVSSRFLAIRVRKRTKEFEVLGGAATKVDEGATRVEFVDAPCSRVEGRTRGGAWHAFIRAQSWGAKADFAALAEQYRGLSAEERASYQVIGNLATQSYRRTGVAFGAQLASLRSTYKVSYARVIVAVGRRRGASWGCGRGARLGHGAPRLYQRG